MRSKSLHRFVWVVAAGGAASAAWTALHLTWPAWTADGLAVTVLLAAGLVVGEWLPTRIWRGDTFRQYTFSGTFTVGLIITGPFWLAALLQTGALLTDEIRRRSPPLKLAFNLSQYLLAMTCARIVYAALTDQPFGGYSERFTTDQLLPSLLAAAVYFLVNVILVSVVLALANEERLLPSVVGHLRDEISMTTMLLCVAPGRGAVAAVLPAHRTALPAADRRGAPGGPRGRRQQRPGHARLPDRSAQPQPADAARAPARRPGPRRGADRVAAAGPRPLQGDQRHPRAPRG